MNKTLAKMNALLTPTGVRNVAAEYRRQGAILHAAKIEAFADLFEIALQQEEREYIVCSAIHFNDGRTDHPHLPHNIKSGFVTYGKGHHQCINAFAKIMGFPYSESSLVVLRTEVQGFMTSKYRFVEREEAGQIAYDAGQTSELIKELHSEDL